MHKKIWLFSLVCFTTAPLFAMAQTTAPDQRMNTPTTQDRTTSSGQMDQNRANPARTDANRDQRKAMDKKHENLTKADFSNKVAQAGKYEIESSRLALSKSNNANVKTLAQKLIDDHTKADEKLKSITPATANVSMDKKHQDKLESLKNSQNFDADYLNQQEQAHRKSVDMFTAYSKNGDDQALKQFAQETLPTLQGHLRQVQNLKNNNR